MTTCRDDEAGLRGRKAPARSHSEKRNEREKGFSR